MDFHPKLAFVIFLFIFVSVYITILIRKAVKDSIDLYDFFLLSMIAIIPFSFVVFPSFYNKLARFVGVAFPFLFLFGSLFLVVFIYLYRLVIKANSEERSIVRLAQELALLKQQITTPPPP